CGPAWPTARRTTSPAAASPTRRAWWRRRGSRPCCVPGRARPMQTTLYLVRHGATEANVARPPRLQGRRHDPPLAPLGVRQAEARRDSLAGRRVDVCYCSPMLRAVQTAALLAAPHGLAPRPLEAITECDVGRWEGLDRQTIAEFDAEAHRLFLL